MSLVFAICHHQDSARSQAADALSLLLPRARLELQVCAAPRGGGGRAVGKTEAAQAGAHHQRQRAVFVGLRVRRCTTRFTYIGQVWQGHALSLLQKSLHVLAVSGARPNEAKRT